MRSVFDDIVDERTRQVEKWEDEFDDDYTPEQWITLMGRYADKVRHGVGIQDQRRRFIQIAALAVAAVEALDRKAELE